MRGRFGGSFGLPEEFSCVLFDPEDQRASIRVDAGNSCTAQVLSI